MLNDFVLEWSRLPQRPAGGCSGCGLALALQAPGSENPPDRKPVHLRTRGNWSSGTDLVDRGARAGRTELVGRRSLCVRVNSREHNAQRTHGLGCRRVSELVRQTVCASENSWDGARESQRTRETGGLVCQSELVCIVHRVLMGLAAFGLAN